MKYPFHIVDVFSSTFGGTLLFWPRLSLAEMFTVWFLFVAPIATIIAAVTLIRRRRSAHIATFTRILAWTTITVSVLVNAF
jgi:cytochrome c-type biogenesis protein CcmH/NrfF